MGPYNYGGTYPLSSLELHFQVEAAIFHMASLPFFLPQRSQKRSCVLQDAGAPGAPLTGAPVLWDDPS